MMSSLNTFTVFAIFLAYSLVDMATAQKKATLTRYCSYPPCCKSKGITYTSAEKKFCGKDECSDYSGCKYEGQLAYCNLSRDQIIKTNIVAFFSKTSGEINQYQGKTLRITQGNKKIDAKVCDTCGDKDCNNCCTKNAGSNNYLIDLEANTLARSGFSGSGTVSFTCLDC